MASSYISEHTAEYYLVPALTKILTKKYSYVAPVFPWISREFSRISKKIHQDDKFHILVMFPRRPKLCSEQDNDIYITINPELAEFYNIAEAKKVPVLVGWPLAKNIWELSKCQYKWSNLSKNIDSQYLNSTRALEQNGLILDEIDIYNLVEKSSIFDYLSFHNFISVLKEVRPYRPYGGFYKPVYFLIKC